MTKLPTNNNFPRLLGELTAQGDAAKIAASSTTEYRQFIARFPRDQLEKLGLDDYCVGKRDNASFCWWIERGLEPVLGRYMPGTSRGHLLYFEKDGTLYKNRELSGLDDDTALRYVLRLHATVAAASPEEDLGWLDDDRAIQQRTGLPIRLSLGKGRKLRLLSCYHPEAFLPISSSDHIAHFLETLGCPSGQIPDGPVARMLLLKKYYLAAAEAVPGLSVSGFMRALYSDTLGLKPSKPEQADDGQATEEMQPEESDRMSNPGHARQPLNQILFGPPGTGKTFSVVEESLRILQPELFERGVPDWATDLKPAFDQLVAIGRIVFTTFHQSFSYEDFVEGVRAEAGEQGELQYFIADGVFKALCEQARRGVSADEDPFEQALSKLAQRAEDAEDGLLEMRTSKGKRFKARYEGKQTFLVYPESSVDLRSGYTGNMAHVRALHESGDTSKTYNLSYVRGMLDYLRKHCGLPATPTKHDKDSHAKPFVLIIDEINRGNVSRIFGELITLIEGPKRAGQEEALEVTLPYSKQRFSVPDNLYLIGTMNTADRSLATLDIALRRRFSFVEMPPRPDLLDGVLVEDVDVGAILRAMNERIEVLLDRDHCLGHAYFMPLKDEPSLMRLAAIFRENILPLLQEYFFEDWQRIQWVLNDHRKPAELCFLREPQSDLERLFGSGVAVNGAGRRWTLNESAFARIGAYAGIIEASGA